MRASVAVLACLAASCAARGGLPEGGARRERPHVVVLGTAQDGGLPQIGCRGEACRRAREDPGAARLVTSLLLVDPEGAKRYLFDATPDLPAQIERARGIPPGRVHGGPRPPLVDGIFLTHAHMGHYTGLLHLGPEAYGARGVAVHASPRMAAFLRENGPWSLLVENGTLRLIEMEPYRAVRLGDGLSVTAIPVPHREELSDTVAYRIDGPSRSVLYLPDIDKWERWDTRIEEVIGGVDVAFLDGTFFGEGEVPGRDLASIPHPFVEESLERFGALPAGEREKVWFTHLNHTNPLCDPASEAATAVRSAGMGVAFEGQVVEL